MGITGANEGVSCYFGSRCGGLAKGSGRIRAESLRTRRGTFLRVTGCNNEKIRGKGLFAATDPYRLYSGGTCRLNVGRVCCVSPCPKVTIDRVLVKNDQGPRLMVFSKTVNETFRGLCSPGLSCGSRLGTLTLWLLLANKSKSVFRVGSSYI